MTNIKVMAKYERKSWLDTYNMKIDWTEVKLSKKRFPSGLREVVTFPNGMVVKADYCKICYVFEK